MTANPADWPPAARLQTDFEDHLAAIAKDSQKYNTTDQEIDLALLVDGLQAEREQGITIDVAYRLFQHRPAQIHHCRLPGPRAIYPQYGHRRLHLRPGGDPDRRPSWRANANRRHSFIVSLLGVRHVIVAVNKMDLVDFSQQVFDDIRREYLAFAEGRTSPTSALCRFPRCAATMWSAPANARRGTTARR